MNRKKRPYIGAFSSLGALHIAKTEEYFPSRRGIADSNKPASLTCTSWFAIRPTRNRNKAASHPACKLGEPRVYLERQRRSLPLRRFQSVKCGWQGRAADAM